MRDIPILISIFVYMFLLGLITSLMAADSSLSEIETLNNNFTVVGSDFNITNQETEGVQTPVGIWNTLKFMFGFSSPFTGLPSLFGTIVSFFDWLLVVLGIILVYRLIRHGGG